MMSGNSFKRDMFCLIFSKYIYRGFILHLLVIAFAIFSHFQTHFNHFWKNKHDDPIFSVQKLVV